MCQPRPLFVLFKNRIQILIPKVKHWCRDWDVNQGCRILGADGSTELRRPPQHSLLIGYFNGVTVILFFNVVRVVLVVVVRIGKGLWQGHLRPAEDAIGVVNEDQKVVRAASGVLVSISRKPFKFHFN